MGKTTILRLVFHLLSPENNRGHRNFLRDTHFEIIEVKLFSGVTVSARHEDPLKRSVLILQNKQCINSSEQRARGNTRDLDIQKTFERNSRAR